MTRRLFWKILIGFWATFFIVTQAIWLSFVILNPPQQSEYAHSLARIPVLAAASAIRLDGEKGARAQLAQWPRDQRENMEIVRAGNGKAFARNTLAEAEAVAPDGTRYRIAYLTPNVFGHGPSFISGDVAVVAGLGGLAFSAILAWYLTRPVNQLRAGFGRLARGDFHTRLGPAMGSRRDEIADLARDFDIMAARLGELVTSRDRLLADVSHELRTPLARLALAIELARQDPAKLESSLNRIRGEAAKLDEMVGELLALAKLESERAREETYFDLAEIAKVVVQDARYEASAKGAHVELLIDEPDKGREWIVAGNGKLMSRALENIVRNAVRYSQDSSSVLVSLGRQSGLFRIVVSDEGPGVPREALGSLFKPFEYSADGSGFGLGLSIAHRAIAVNGGTISARNREPHGLEMTLEIPAAPIAMA
jgi:two-component system OmpR family sensor kinase